MKPLLRQLQDFTLLVTASGMVGYELVEMLVLEATHGPRFSLAIALHSFQVGVILAVAWRLRRAFREKTEHERALERMVEKIAFVQESERRRLALDLHDAISPLIVSAKQHAETVRARLDDAPRADAELSRTIERLDQAIVETRRILRSLRPPAVDARGLAAAIRCCLDEAAEASDWTVRFDDDLGDTQLSAAVETAAFRIAQEAITNASRHARARRVEVSLRHDPEGLELCVRDHGAGFTPDAPSRRGLGLVSMRERATMLGGACQIESAHEAGTTVRVRLPLIAERP